MASKLDDFLDEIDSEEIPTYDTEFNSPIDITPNIFDEEVKSREGQQRKPAPIPKGKPQKEPARKQRSKKPKGIFVPTPEQKVFVTMMSATGVTLGKQARALGCSTTILQRYFKDELEIGNERACAEVGSALFKKAMDGNVPAQIFFLKSRAGWREPTQVEITGKDGKDLLNPTERAQRVVHILQEHPKLLKEKQIKDDSAD